MSAVNTDKRKSWFKRQVVPVAVGLMSVGLVYGALNIEVLYARFNYARQSQAVVSAEPATAKIESPKPVITNNRLYISKINADLPVIYDQPSIKESDVQLALRRGVLHYGPTAYPGERGNVVIFGHSSSPVWVPGDYKFAFTLLDKLATGDKIYLTYQDVQYEYTVYMTHVIDPTDTSVLDQDDDVTLSLVTCTPVGTSKNRLVVMARQTAPDPETAKPLTAVGRAAIDTLPR